MKNKLVIIGHRMGKGTLVAKGLEKTGMQVFVIPGMGADMKLGDVMKEKNAKYGISFCGSGGAGAITAANKYGFKQKSSLRTIADGVGAIHQGFDVLGFGFMDIEELGENLGNAWTKRDFEKT